ncbi:MAG: alpha/beta fold hydrolase [Gammaproteobacteria bacterium]|jgi:pimeloyl-ACP methyl ester carboxylesterase|nr:alpha/beta fold hydrolase [Gammaproteobacteria bacterium]
MTITTSTRHGRGRRFRLIDGLAAFVAILLMLVGLLRLGTTDQGLTTEHRALPEAPLTVYEPTDVDHAPIVVIAHGFSGSRQMMQPFALTLARNGYTVVSLDFPGHGANPRPLEGEIGAPRRAQILLDALAAVVDYAAALPQYDGRLALLGHSMAGDIAVRYASTEAETDPASMPPQSEPTSGRPDRIGVDALVAVSPYLSQELGPYQPNESPANMLFIYGAWEPEMIHQQGREAVAAVAGLPPDQVAAGITYGEQESGSARRLVLADAVEHIGVLYSQQSLEAALSWLNQVFDHQGSGWVDRRGLWLGLYFLGVILLAWPLSRLLPRVSPEPLGAGLDWRRLLPVAALPALFTPLILRPVPSDFLSIAIADYIALHFAVYALLSGIALVLWGKRSNRNPSQERAPASLPALIVALIAVIAYQTLTIALPTDRYVAAFLPDPHRGIILIVLLTATALWFSIDEWITRGEGAAGGAYAFTKGLFLASLMLAVALNLEQLFFLVIIIPAILILFIVFGLFSAWIYRRTGHPLVGALTNALVFAVAITASFPIAD